MMVLVINWMRLMMRSMMIPLEVVRLVKSRLAKTSTSLARLPKLQMPLMRNSFALSVSSHHLG